MENSVANEICISVEKFHSFGNKECDSLITSARIICAAKSELIK